ncbi:hypothetical protein ACI1VM_24440, partial [Escherichia coli]
AGEENEDKAVRVNSNREYIPTPHPLTRSARSFGCGERDGLTDGSEISWGMPGRYLTKKA